MSKQRKVVYLEGTIVIAEMKALLNTKDTHYIITLTDYRKEHPDILELLIKAVTKKETETPDDQ